MPRFKYNPRRIQTFDFTYLDSDDHVALTLNLDNLLQVANGDEYFDLGGYTFPHNEANDAELARVYRLWEAYHDEK